MPAEFVVDFKEYGLEIVDPSTASLDKLKELGEKIVNCFKTNGFCYLKNHGVNEELLKDYMKVSRDFFDKPVEFKAKYPLGQDYSFGWVQVGREKPNPDRSVGDLHEAFNSLPINDTNWPPVDNFEMLSKQLFKAYKQLAFRFFDVLSLGLGLPIDFMRNAHKKLGQTGNGSVIRTIYYPPIQPDNIQAQDQVRLGEHADWSMLTFDFQDSNGGLEVKNPQGEFISADPLPGTVLVIVGELLQRLTSDMLTATVHRILIPKEESRRRVYRQASIFFIHSDDDYVVKCIDGSDKYDPISAIDYNAYRANVATKQNYK